MMNGISILVESDPDIDQKWHSYFKEFRAEQPVIAPPDWISKCHATVQPAKDNEKNLQSFVFLMPGVIFCRLFDFC